MKCARERLGSSLVAIGATAALATGCSEQVSGMPQRATEAVSSSILDQPPQGVDPDAWCGFVAARETIKWVTKDSQVSEHDRVYFGKNQSQVAVGRTAVGYVFRLEAMPSMQYVVRGEMEVASLEDTPLAALETVSLRDDVVFNSEAPVAVWDLWGDAGGTTSRPESLCAVASDVVRLLDN